MRMGWQAHAPPLHLPPTHPPTHHHHHHLGWLAPVLLSLLGILQATSNYEFVLPLEDVLSGIVPPSSLQYSVDLAAVPWLSLDVVVGR